MTDQICGILKQILTCSRVFPKFLSDIRSYDLVKDLENDNTKQEILS